MLVLLLTLVSGVLLLLLQGSSLWWAISCGLGGRCSALVASTFAPGLAHRGQLGRRNELRPGCPSADALVHDAAQRVYVTLLVHTCAVEQLCSASI
jgi:hypothetical protein